MLEHYNVHILDIAPRPASLPRTTSLTYHRGSIDPSSAALSKLFRKTKFDGVVHLAAVSLEEWCEPRLADCERINVEGTKAILEQLRSSSSSGRRGLVPWMLMASAIDTETAVGRTKLAAEQALEQVHEGRVGIVRMDEVYGYAPSTPIASTFLPSLISSALTGLPIQYSSDRPARHYTHIDDVLEGLRLAIEHVKRTPGVSHLDLVSGSSKTEVELVDFVRKQTGSMSPVRDLGASRAPAPTAGHAHHPSSTDLGWTAAIDIESGLAGMINTLVSETERYSLQYLADNCPSSDLLALAPFTSPVSTGPRQGANPADERNKDMTKMDGCTVNIGFDHAGFLHHLKCEDGKHCIVDGAKVNGYNWNQTVWIVRRVKGGPKGERRVRVMFEEEQGTGWLGLRQGGAGREVGLELFSKDDPNAQTVFDLEVSHTPRRSALLRWNRY